MPKLEIFDPPLCCPTGVCGPSVDPALMQFAGSLAWLRRQGVVIERRNLAQEPEAFAACAAVKQLAARALISAALVSETRNLLGRRRGRAR